MNFSGLAIGVICSKPLSAGGGHFLVAGIFKKANFVP